MGIIYGISLHITAVKSRPTGIVNIVVQVKMNELDAQNRTEQKCYYT